MAPVVRPDDAVVGELASAYDRRDPDRSIAAAAELIGACRVDDLDAWWHPLGFFRFDLALDSNGCRYTMHCWPPGIRATQNPAWTIHRHVWELESLIVEGGLRDTQFVSNDAADDRCTGVVYLAGSAPGRVSLLERTERRIGLAPDVDDFRRAGQFYNVSLSSFHESLVHPDGACLTLVRIGPRLRSRSEVVGEEHAPAALRYLHEPVDKGLLLDGLAMAGLHPRG
ncbi:hypothetical protein AB0H83_37275 [Dactylosporangium sp. NPDC050688]|uniref:hypothetical protein n=1 Tax=Dactylosporangium sp. NPDC050688 TaxID=3157217 RepID=UPI0033C33CE3